MYPGLLSQRKLLWGLIRIGVINADNISDQPWADAGPHHHTAWQGTPVLPICLQMCAVCEPSAQLEDLHVLTREAAQQSFCVP